MDFISQNDYLIHVVYHNMIDKHAIWCQCCATIHFTLLAVSVVSFQHITLVPDIYWTCIFLFNATTHFVVGEHAPVFNINTGTWMKIEKIRGTVIQCILFYWNINPWHFSSYIFLQIPCFVGLSYVIHKPEKIFPVVVVLKLLMAPDINLIFLSAFAITNYFAKNINIKQQSFASIKMKQKYALKAGSIILEAILLWNLRCEHRFPHLIRWKPLFSAFIACGLVTLWAHFNVLDTFVSNNAIIVENGHGMAASLTAAQKCKHCATNITSLDMESSFSS